jgi:hypothetical protein
MIAVIKGIHETLGSQWIDTPPRYSGKQKEEVSSY